LITAPVPGRSRDRQGLADLGDHAVPVRASAGTDWLRNPSYFNQDLSVRRDFPIARVKLGLGLDVFNVFNTVELGLRNCSIELV
jgi:hypothetical protein